MDARIQSLLDDLGVTENRRVSQEILVSAFGLVRDIDDRLDLKIASAALYELWDAFNTFAPHKDLKKVTVFGSARTRPEDPAYQLAKGLAAELAEAGWFIVTGAGPGIMLAANEGAGRERSFGVNIQLPFEQEANQFLVGDEKLVEMRYFFTRKLMLSKESSAFIALPGGFGTQDETLELLTLLQTGKAEPVPLVLLDVPGGTYWTQWDEYVRAQLSDGGYISSDDTDLYTLVTTVDEACAEINGFYSNYHSTKMSSSCLESPSSTTFATTETGDHSSISSTGPNQTSTDHPSGKWGAVGRVAKEAGFLLACSADTGCRELANRYATLSQDVSVGNRCDYRSSANRDVPGDPRCPEDR